jgi:hypothetical protein
VTGFRARRLQRVSEAKLALAQMAKTERARERRNVKRIRDEYHEQLHPLLFKDHKLIVSSSDDENVYNAFKGDFCRNLPFFWRNFVFFGGFRTEFPPELPFFFGGFLQNC